ncbi:MAG: M23 family metallopeptidase [Cyanobacteria bacterium J083]|nr:MAG: M23 family metallopeptidase [Cyanobacteria bacterium J083]
MNYKLLSSYPYLILLTLVSSLVATYSPAIAEGNSFVIQVKPQKPTPLKPKTNPTIKPKTRLSLQKPPKKLSAPKIKKTQPLISQKNQINASFNSNSGKNNYIDTTSYHQKPRKNYLPPNSIVLQERKRGCTTVVSKGTFPQGSCNKLVIKQSTLAYAPPPPPSPRSQARRKQISQINRPKKIAQHTTKIARNIVARSNNRINSRGKTSISRYNRSAIYVPQTQSQNTALIFPLSIPASITSVFGWRNHPITGLPRMHSGTDIGAPLGTPVLATYSGQVVVANNLGGYGKIVILRHENNTQESRYAHLSEIFVQPGEWVEQGKIIGLVGSTGNSTGPHLHFEWRHLTPQGWVAVDSGLHLEYALENLIQAMEKPRTGILSSAYNFKNFHS